MEFEVFNIHGELDRANRKTKIDEWYFSRSGCDISIEYGLSISKTFQNLGQIPCVRYLWSHNNKRVIETGLRFWVWSCVMISTLNFEIITCDYVFEKSESWPDLLMIFCDEYDPVFI